MAQVLELKFSRIQFTPDLMPSDITGTDIIQEDADTGNRKMVFAPGPVFTNILLADEINREPPPNAVGATSRPCRNTGHGSRADVSSSRAVFRFRDPESDRARRHIPASEAQLDRFMFHIKIDHPPEGEELEVVRTTTIVQRHEFRHAVSGPTSSHFRSWSARCRMSEVVLRYALSLAVPAGPQASDAPDFIKKWVAYGASVRAAQYLILGGKARAVTQGRYHVNFDDIRALAHPVMRHRVLLNFHAESEGITTDQIVDQLLEAVSVPVSQM